MAKKKIMKPVHPGEILMKEFLEPLQLSQNQLARDLGTSPRRINEIVLERRGITADTALRLSKYFQTTPQFWLNLQNHYELETRKDTIGEALNKHVKKFHFAS